MRIKISEIAFVKPFWSKFVKPFVNPEMQQNSIYPSLTLFLAFVNRYISLCKKFVFRDSSVVSSFIIYCELSSVSGNACACCLLDGDY